MRKVILRMNEQHKYEVIKNLVDNSGNKKRAAIELNCTIRTINRLIIKYKSEGKAGFIHKNRERKPAIALSESVKNEIILLFENKYYDANWNHVLELLNENENIKISYCTLYNLLTSKGFISPKCNRITKKNRAKELKEKLKNKEKLTIQEEDLIVCNNILALEDSHPRQPRCKYFGEKMLMDASEFIWFGDQKSTLHGAIDDATGAIKLYFDKQETLKGYYGLLNSILIDFGIPYLILTDNRTVFYYNSKKDVELVNDTYTQFGYACKRLGIDLQTTSIPQKKGRIERLWNTLQSRLPVEMRLAGVNTIEEANLFILDYCEKFNQQFALPINNTKNVFEKQPSIEEINYTLAILTPRVFDNGSSIKYQKKYWQAFKDNKLVCSAISNIPLVKTFIFSTDFDFSKAACKLSLSFSLTSFAFFSNLIAFSLRIAALLAIVIDDSTPSSASLTTPFISLFISIEAAFTSSVEAAVSSIPAAISSVVDDTSSIFSFKDSI